MKNSAVKEMLLVHYGIPAEQNDRVDVQFQASIFGDEHYVAEIYPVTFVDPEITPTLKLQLTIRVTEVK